MTEWCPSQSQQTQLAPPSNLQEVQNAQTHSWTLRQNFHVSPPPCVNRKFIQVKKKLQPELRSFLCDESWRIQCCFCFHTNKSQTSWRLVERSIMGNLWNHYLLVHMWMSLFKNWNDTWTLARTSLLAVVLLLCRWFVSSCVPVLLPGGDNGDDADLALICGSQRPLCSHHSW